MRVWLVPTGLDAMTITLPVRACTETDAVCFDTTQVAVAAVTTVPGPLEAITEAITALPQVDLPTARFEELPPNHDGSTPIEFELHFSEEPQDLSYTTVGGALLEVTGGRVTGARRLTPNDNSEWEVTAEPTGNDDMVISLPNRSCGEANAICIGGQPLAQTVRATVRRAEQAPPAPFHASFGGNTPTEHDKGRFELEFHLSHAPQDSFSYETVRDDLFTVTGGTVESASRRTRGAEKNMHWNLRVVPDGGGDVTLALKPTTDCATLPGVCRQTDDAMLDSDLAVTIKGPATISVADAAVAEANGATLDFVVTLSRSRAAETTVEYATSDGTATAGADYTAKSGTLTFGSNETSKTISVEVLNDAHNDDNETMTLTLSNPVGATISDGTATGTIENNDPMPKAWSTRFGRTVGTQVVDALGSRLDGNPGTHVTVGGMNLMGTTRAPEEDPVPELRLPDWDERSQLDARTRSMTTEQAILGSSFHLSTEKREGGYGAFSAWGRFATSGFDAQEDEVVLDGDVTTGMLGVDGEWESLLAGVLVTQSSGDGSYRLATGGEDSGEVESTLTGIYPYARLNLNARVSAWGVLGTGSGELTLRQKGSEAIETDLGLWMGAIGLKGRLLDGTGPSGVGLNLRSDAMWISTETDEVQGLKRAKGEVSRLRLILQGERSFATEGGGRFVPRAELGLRLDGGDAETGTGLEAGAGVQYTWGSFAIEGQIRGLVAHEESGYEEWGASGAIRVSPSASGRGLTASLMPVWGNAGSAAERLWGAQDAGSLGAGDEFEPVARLEAELGYGMSVPRTPGVLIPYTGMSLTEGAGQILRAGTRWNLVPGAVLGLEATREEGAGESVPRHSIRFQTELRW